MAITSCNQNASESDPACLLGRGIRHVYWEEASCMFTGNRHPACLLRTRVCKSRPSTLQKPKLQGIHHQHPKQYCSIKMSATPSQLTGQAVWSLHTYSYELQWWSCWRASQKMPVQAKLTHETGPKGQQSNWSGLPVGHRHLALQWSAEQHLPPLPREHLSYDAADPVVVPVSFGFNWHHFYAFTYQMTFYPHVCCRHCDLICCFISNCRQRVTHACLAPQNSLCAVNTWHFFMYIFISGISSPCLPLLWFNLL